MPCAGTAPAVTANLNITAPPRCAVLLWRHLVHCGGTSVRHAFELLELSVGTQRWTAVGRDQDVRQSAMPFFCARDPLHGPSLQTLRASALVEVDRCVQSQHHARDVIAAVARGWSLEYHVENAAPALAKHQRWLLSMASAVSAAVLRVVAMVVVRSPLGWLRSQFAHPEGSLLGKGSKVGNRSGARAPGLASRNASAFALGQGGAVQWTALTRGSGWARPGDESMQTMHAVLSGFEIVGVLERLDDVMLCACERMRLAQCPVLLREHTAAAVREHDDWPTSLDQAALTQLIGTTDLRLHSLAVERLDAATRTLNAANLRLYQTAVLGTNVGIDPGPTPDGALEHKPADRASDLPERPTTERAPSTRRPACPALPAQRLLPYAWVRPPALSSAMAKNATTSRMDSRTNYALHRCIAVPQKDVTE